MEWPVLGDSLATSCSLWIIMSFTVLADEGDGLPNWQLSEEDQPQPVAFGQDAEQITSTRLVGMSTSGSHIRRRRSRILSRMAAASSNSRRSAAWRISFSSSLIVWESSSRVSRSGAAGSRISSAR